MLLAVAEQFLHSIKAFFFTLFCWQVGWLWVVTWEEMELGQLI